MAGLVLRRMRYLRFTVPCGSLVRPRQNDALF